MSDVDLHLFISLVQEHPCLWDTSDENYRQFIKQEAWKSVCEIIYANYSKKDVREKSKLVDIKAIIINSKIKEYHMNKQLQFLIKGILPSLKTLNDHQTLIFQSLRPSIQENTPHGYTQGYQQGYSTHRYHNKSELVSYLNFAVPRSAHVRASSNQECEINSPLPLDETSASYGTQDEEFDFS
ncbi:hypothetical protein ABMA28_000196 [Loxostege sticticalis]|uniref:MADF domain-containing protein n=1 Tax=Loxostege sticticalis TaxID=481309 RepID=A0ABD0TRE0_LOXSC